MPNTKNAIEDGYKQEFRTGCKQILLDGSRRECLAEYGDDMVTKNPAPAELPPLSANYVPKC